MTVLSHGLSWIDLEFLGRPQAIAAGIVQGPDGVAIVDPGPSTCLQTLERALDRAGIRFGDVRALLLTHIHLDHAGAAGTIVRANPQMRVFVHERGARHLADPGKLIDSAARLYGDRMSSLWGEIAPVPADNLVPLAGGERLEAGGRQFEVAYTPGHASHHVSYFDRSSGVAFVGDTAGICIDGGYVLPPTPPPDVDVEAWRTSIERIEAWGPATLFLTHFGPAPSVGPHLQALVDHLETMAAQVRRTLDRPGSDEQRMQEFVAWLRAELRRNVPEARLASYGVAAQHEHLWLGLARYWRKKDQGRD
ncbi:MAG TPA: MBL fold metallo-hydrolase [Vicinamibacterales bacterium]|nr:MBL fold metallo-hydrolase [Vicinamibacterales bacterium]